MKRRITNNELELNPKPDVLNRRVQDMALVELL